MEASTYLWTNASASEYVNNVSASTQSLSEEEEDSYAELLFDIERYLWLYVAPTIIVIGTVGNIFSLITLQATKFRGTAVSFTLSSLAIVDTLVLYTSLLRFWIIYLADLDVRTLSIPVCKVHIFFSRFFIHLSSWILVQVTVERAVFVFLPTKAWHICSKNRAVISWLVLASVLLMVNARYFWTHTVIETRLTNLGLHELELDSRYHGYDSNVPSQLCHLQSGVAGKSDNLWSWLDLVFISAVPFVIICGINAAVICRLVGRQRQLVTNRQRWSSVTKMLVVVSIVFLLTTLPSAIYFVGHWDWFAMPLTARTEAEMGVTHAVVTLVLYSNNATNFWLYVISGRSFRKALAKTLCGPPVPRFRDSDRQSRRGAISHIQIDINIFSNENADVPRSEEDTSPSVNVTMM